MIKWEALPAHWDIVRIEDVGTIVSGGTPSRNVPSYWNGDIPWVTPSEITSLKDKWLNNAREHITARGLQYSSAQLLPPTSLLITSRATVGEVAIAKNAVATNQGFKSLVTNPGNNPVFYYYVMKYISSEMVRLASGSTFDEISKRDFSKIRVPRPPLPEQRAIAYILDTLDREIQETSAIIDKLQQTKIGLLDDLLTHGLDEKGNLRDPKRNPESFETTRLGLIPKSWSVETLERYTVSSAFGPRFPGKAYTDDGNVATLRTTDLDGDGNINLNTMPRAQLNLVSFQSHLLQANDFLITRSGTVGIATVFEGYTLPVLPGAFLIRFRFNDLLSAHYARLYFNWEIGRHKVLLLAEGGVQKNLKGSSLLRLSIPIPKIEEQRRIIEFIRTHTDRVDEEEQYILKLQLLRKGLLDDLLTGRVRMTNIDIDAEIDNLR